MRYILTPFAILYVIYLRKRYKRLTLKWSNAHSNQHIAVLQLLQAKIHYYKNQFEYWGYYQPGCVGKPRWDRLLSWLFPPKDYDEWDILSWSNPEAVTYYHNRLFNAGIHPDYSIEIKKQLIKWNDNY